MNLLRTRSTYKTAANAEAKLRKELELRGGSLDSARYLIAVSADGRFAPVLVGIDYLPLAIDAGITVVS